jgi:hypothetical protein
VVDIDPSLYNMSLDVTIPRGADGTNGTGTGTGDHHLLTNLTDGDDHTQYLNLSGRTGGQIVTGQLGSTSNVTFNSSGLIISKGNLYLDNNQAIRAVNATGGVGNVAIVGSDNTFIWRALWSRMRFQDAAATDVLYIYSDPNTPSTRGVYGTQDAVGSLVLRSTTNANKGNVTIADDGGKVNIGTATPDAGYIIRVVGNMSDYFAPTPGQYNPVLQKNGMLLSDFWTGYAYTNHYSATTSGSNVSGSQLYVINSRPDITSTGSITTVASYNAEPYIEGANSNGNITTMVSFLAAGGYYAAGTAQKITDWVQFYAYSPPTTSGGNITNAYGLRIKNVSAGRVLNYNIYSEGSAINYFGGQVAVGTGTPNANASLQIDSTTKAFLPPRMTGAQKEAIVSPPTGSVVFDTTNNTISVKNSSNWINLGESGGGSTLTKSQICEYMYPVAYTKGVVMNISNATFESDVGCGIWRLVGNVSVS